MPDDQKAKEFIEDYNRKSKSKIASITQLESGSVVVAVVDEFSKRVHKTIVQSGQICFVDGTSSLVRMNHPFIKLMTESPRLLQEEESRLVLSCS